MNPFCKTVENGLVVDGDNYKEGYVSLGTGFTLWNK